MSKWWSKWIWGDSKVCALWESFSFGCLSFLAKITLELFSDILRAYGSLYYMHLLWKMFHIHCGNCVVCLKEGHFHDKHIEDSLFFRRLHFQATVVGWDFVDILFLQQRWFSCNTWTCNTWALVRVELVGSKGGLQCAGTPQILMPSWPPATHAPRLFLGTFHRFSSRTLQVGNFFLMTHRPLGLHALWVSMGTWYAVILTQHLA